MFLSSPCFLHLLPGVLAGWRQRYVTIQLPCTSTLLWHNSHPPPSLWTPWHLILELPVWRTNKTMTHGKGQEQLDLITLAYEDWETYMRNLKNHVPPNLTIIHTLSPGHSLQVWYLVLQLVSIIVLIKKSPAKSLSFLLSPWEIE